MVALNRQRNLINFFRWSTTIHLAPSYTSNLVLGERVVTAKPGPDEICAGMLKHCERIIQPDVHTAWFPKRPSGKELVEAIVVLFFQGGGFVTATDLGKSPAAQQVVVTLYNYILADLGVPAENVVISGESAGGNLVVGLMRYIEETARLPAPRGALIWPLWVDVSSSALAEYQSNLRRKTDILNL
jgi:hypothetical protein